MMETYATNDFIAKAEAEITSFWEPAGVTAVRYSEAFLGEGTKIWHGIQQSKVKGYIYRGLKSFFPVFNAYFLKGTQGGYRNKQNSDLLISCR